MPRSGLPISHSFKSAWLDIVITASYFFVLSECLPTLGYPLFGGYDESDTFQYAYAQCQGIPLLRLIQAVCLDPESVFLQHLFGRYLIEQALR